MTNETKIISGILISTAACIALIAGLTFALVPNEYGKEMNINNKQYTFSGKVINAQNQAIADARITILRQSDLMQTNNRQSMSDKSDLKTVLTDGSGKFKIESISSGTYTHKVEADGYKTSNQQVTITKDINLIVTLEPSQK